MSVHKRASSRCRIVRASKERGPLGEYTRLFSKLALAREFLQQRHYRTSEFSRETLQSGKFYGTITRVQIRRPSSGLFLISRLVALVQNITCTCIIYNSAYLFQSCVKVQNLCFLRERERGNNVIQFYLFNFILGNVSSSISFDTR